MGKCNHKQPKPLTPFFCELEEGHCGSHLASTVAAGHYITWPQESEAFAEALADLVKLYADSRLLPK